MGTLIVLLAITIIFTQPPHLKITEDYIKIGFRKYFLDEIILLNYSKRTTVAGTKVVLEIHTKDSYGKIDMNTISRNKNDIASQLLGARY